MSEYWTPLRDEARRYWQRRREQLEAEQQDRRDWISGLKERFGIICWGDGAPARLLPDWPVLPDGTQSGDYRLVSEHAMVSYDGVNFYVKPDGMPTAEWLASLR
jgi:hypothetical protein